jgi:hypothetical protein
VFGTYGETYISSLLSDERGNLYSLILTSEDVGPDARTVFKADISGKGLWSASERDYSWNWTGPVLLPDGRLLLWNWPDFRIIDEDGTLLQDWTLFDSTYWSMITALPDGRLVGVKYRENDAVLAIGDIHGEQRWMQLPGKGEKYTWTGLEALSEHEVVLSGGPGILLVDILAETSRIIVDSNRLRPFERAYMQVGPGRSIFCAGEPNIYKTEEAGLPTTLHCFDDRGSERWSLVLPDFQLRGFLPITADEVLLGTIADGNYGSSIAVVRKMNAGGGIVWEWRPEHNTVPPETGIRTVVSTAPTRYVALPDGSLIISGTAVGWTSADECAWLARLLPDGRLDKTFGSPSPAQ